MVFIGSSDNTLYALSADSGEVKWTYNSIGNLGHSSPVIGGDSSLYLATYSSASTSVGLLLSFDSRSGALHWTVRLNGDSSGPAIGADGKIKPINLKQYLLFPLLYLYFVSN
jgi:outer membrane protein assembly factor BamB